MTSPGNDAARDEKRTAHLIVAVAALGYFVDIYDLILFGVLRVTSLKDLGVPKDALLGTGVHLINMQMGGMLLGGILWGILGDKRGRVSVLFGSIFLYSVANIANAYVHSVEAYAWMRLLAGIGLAGELGAGVTLVSEVLSREWRGYGTTIVAFVGVCGAVAAVCVGGTFPWRTSYVIGGVLGLALLVLRIGTFESGLFERLKATPVRRGAFVSLFTSWNRARRYVAVVLTGLPIWYVIGILVLFSPEIGGALHVQPAPEAPRAILFGYIGLAIGDLGSGVLSQVFRTRKRVVGAFLGITAAAIAIYFLAGGLSLGTFYASCLLLGVGGGYWAVFVTMASEQFGTNMRATVTTTAPNFVRGALVPMTSAFVALKATQLGVIGGALAVGVAALLIAAIALSRLDETYGKDLDFVEPL